MQRVLSADIKYNNVNAGKSIRPRKINTKRRRARVLSTTYYGCEERSRNIYKNDNIDDWTSLVLMDEKYLVSRTNRPSTRTSILDRRFTSLSCVFVCSSHSYGQGRLVSSSYISRIYICTTKIMDGIMMRRWMRSHDAVQCECASRSLQNALWHRVSTPPLRGSTRWYEACNPPGIWSHDMQ